MTNNNEQRKKDYKRYCEAVKSAMAKIEGASTVNAIAVVGDNGQAMVWQFGPDFEYEFCRTAIELELRKEKWFPVTGIAKRIDKPTAPKKNAAPKAKKARSK